MNCILRTALAITIVVGFGGTHASKALWACGGACSEGGGHSNQESSDHIIQAKAEVKGEKAEAIKDPVCGMEVSDIKKASSEEYNGKVYYFCSEHCKKTFKKDPSSYVVKETHQHDEGEGH
ncbi:MAG: YHS domain-containing protein, partial [Planctomycetes bacterium]|nr:YHS domain-containing protein [Planctomycetota bacterium]